MQTQKNCLGKGILLCFTMLVILMQAAAQGKYPMEPALVEAGIKELASSKVSMVTSAHPFATNAVCQSCGRRDSDGRDCL